MEPLSHTFHGSDDFQACYAAEKFLLDAGFSYGSMEGRKPRGVLFGNYTISKWRNLSLADVRALHGLLDAPNGFRAGPVTATLTNDAPETAREAFKIACSALVRTAPAETSGLITEQNKATSANAGEK